MGVVDRFLLWRKWDNRDADFIGPVEPPMIRCLRREGEERRAALQKTFDASKQPIWPNDLFG